MSGVFSRCEQMYASTQRLLLCTELAPWWVLAAAISIRRFPWTPDALTPAAAALCATPQASKRPGMLGPVPGLLMLILGHCPSLAPYLAL